MAYFEEAESISTIGDTRVATDRGLPSDLPATSYELLRATAARRPDRPAMSFFTDMASCRSTTDWTYRQFANDVTRCANLFQALGIASGDVVALMMPNLPETHFALWGGEAAGIVMPVNPMLEPAAIATLLTAAKARILVTIAPFAGVDLFEKACEVVAQVPTLRHVVLVDVARHVRGLRRIGVRAIGWSARRRAPAMPASVQVHDYHRRIARMPADRLVGGRRIGADDVASYFCTGGTTGLPKIAVRTHGQEVANAWMVTRMLGDAIDERSTLLVGLPLFHVNAVIASGLAVFARGGRVLLATPQGFRAPGLVARLWEVVAHHRVTAFSGVPTLLAALLEHPGKGHDLSSFRYAFSGAAPLSTELLRRFEQAREVGVIEGYGLTESACVASMNPAKGEHRAGSVGLPLPCQHIRIVHVDGNGRFLRDADPGQIGVVSIAGPNVFNGYLEERHNDGLWIERDDGRRWLNTGDLGRVDDDGYLWLTGRAKDLIIRGGHNIDPAMIEDALADHPDVALAAAIGRPDSYAGEVPVAFVQLRTGAVVDAQGLIDHVAGRIGERAAIPKAVIVVEALPLTAVGKIHKPTLRARAIEEVARQALAAAAIPATLSMAVDGQRGDVVRIEMQGDDEARIRDALEPFTFSYDLVRPRTAIDALA